MEVLNRSQITEVVTKRSVSHTLNCFGIVYTRTATISTRMNHMDNDVVFGYEEVKWSRHISSNTVEYLKKKDIKALELELQFQEMKENDRDAYNGNGTNYYDKINGLNN